MSTAPDIFTERATSTTLQPWNANGVEPEPEPPDDIVVVRNRRYRILQHEEPRTRPVEPWLAPTRETHGDAVIVGGLLLDPAESNAADAHLLGRLLGIEWPAYASGYPTAGASENQRRPGMRHLEPRAGQAQEWIPVEGDPRGRVRSIVWGREETAVVPILPGVRYLTADQEELLADVIPGEENHGWAVFALDGGENDDHERRLELGEVGRRRQGFLADGGWHIAPREPTGFPPGRPRAETGEEDAERFWDEFGISRETFDDMEKRRGPQKWTPGEIDARAFIARRLKEMRGNARTGDGWVKLACAALDINRDRLGKIIGRAE